MLWRDLVSEIVYQRDNGLNRNLESVPDEFLLTFQELKVHNLQHRPDQTWQVIIAFHSKLLRETGR